MNFKLNFFIKINILPMQKRHRSETFYSIHLNFLLCLLHFSNKRSNWEHWQHHNLNIIVHFIPLKFTNRAICYAICKIATFYHEQKILENLVCWIYQMTINHATANSLNIHQYSDSFLNQLKPHSVHRYTANQETAQCTRLSTTSANKLLKWIFNVCILCCGFINLFAEFKWFMWFNVMSIYRINLHFQQIHYKPNAKQRFRLKLQKWMHS